MIKILLVDDHQDTLENLSRKIPLHISNTQIITAGNCDTAYYHIQQNNTINVLITDLTIQDGDAYTLSQGKDLLRQMKKDQIKIPSIIYTDHHDIETIYPIIDNFEPFGFILKGSHSHEDLFLAITKALRHESHFSQKVHLKLKSRAKFEHAIDEIDEIIIKTLPEINNAKDWAHSNVPIGERSVRDRLHRLKRDFGVDNNKQLLLRLQRLGFLKTD